MVMENNAILREKLSAAYCWSSPGNASDRALIKEIFEKSIIDNMA